VTTIEQQGGYGHGNVTRSPIEGGEEGGAHASEQQGQAVGSGSQGRSFPKAVAGLFGYVHTHPGRSLLLWIAAIAGVRLGLVLTYDGFLGVDSGAYGLGVLQFFGPPGEYLDTSFSRPPLAPGFLYTPFWFLTDGFTPLGSNLYAAVFSLSILPGFYLLARRIMGQHWGALATVGLTLDWPLGEMFVTGVVPITGFGMLCLVLWGMLGVAEGSQSWRHWLAVILAVPLVAFTNQTTLGIALVAVPIAWLILPNKRANLIALGAGAFLALSALPWYLHVLPGQPRVSYPGPLLYLAPWWQLSSWLQMAGGVALGALVLKLRPHWSRYGYLDIPERVKVPHEGLRLMAVLLIVHAVLNVFLSHDEAVMNIVYRSSYWMSVPFWICAAYVGRRLWQRWQPSLLLAATAASIALAVGAYGVQDQFYGQAHYSDLAGPDVLAALASIPSDDVTRIGTNAESRGFYLAALTQKPVAWVQSALPAAQYVDQETKARCALGWTDCADRGYVSHWLIDTKHTQQVRGLIVGAPDPERPWGDIGPHAPWLTKTFEQGTVQVWTYQPGP
jgi:hypothetical protein